MFDVKNNTKKYTFRIQWNHNENVIFADVLILLY